MPRKGRSSKKETAVPRAMNLLLGRLFGAESPAARKTNRTDREWRKTVLQLLGELDLYQRANIQTDGLHELQLAAALAAAHESATNDKDFWPGVVEGLVRYALSLMGDWPNHHKRTRGRRTADHYELGRHRSITYRQSTHQRFLTLYRAVDTKALGTSTPMWQLMAPYYSRYGYGPNDLRRLEWFRQQHPEIYSRVF
jgi:hypothetical protein